MAITPMKAQGVEHLVERAYREGGQYQWLRETVVNALEAGATRIEFNTEWQAVQSRGVHRRIIADNGCGMTQAQLKSFFNTFGAGSKQIGSVHENFGIGAKTSLLPWNRAGVVVLSRSREVPGVTHMIWLLYDAELNQYGLKEMRSVSEHDEVAKESAVAVTGPFPDQELGLDWSLVMPDWVKDQGTVLLLLGNSFEEDTVVGDQTKGESALNQIASYLNERLWCLPNDVEIRTREYWTRDKDEWPNHDAWRRNENKVNTRLVHGARHYLQKPGQGCDRRGDVYLSDGTKVSWYLWNEPTPSTRRANVGYLAVLYCDELYDIRRNHHAFRHFGIALKSLRERVVLIMKPREYNEKTRSGIYPRHDRNALLYKIGDRAAQAPPLDIWGEEFVESFPPVLRQELEKIYGEQTATLEDSKWRKKLQNRFGKRWRIPTARPDPAGQGAGSPARPNPGLQKAPVRVQKSSPKRKKKEPEGQLLLDDEASGASRKSQTEGGLPSFKIVSGQEFDEGILARWLPNAPQNPEGLILINVDHIVVKELSQHWSLRYPNAIALERDIAHIYGQVAVAKIAHSEQMKKVIGVDKVNDEMRSDLALTMSLLGLYSEDSLIRSYLVGKYGGQKSANAS